MRVPKIDWENGKTYFPSFLQSKTKEENYWTNQSTRRAFWRNRKCLMENNKIKSKKTCLAFPVKVSFEKENLFPLSFWWENFFDSFRLSKFDINFGRKILGTFPNFWRSISVWPDLAHFRHFGTTLIHFGHSELGHVVFAKLFW